MWPGNQTQLGKMRQQIPLWGSSVPVALVSWANEVVENFTTNGAVQSKYIKNRKNMNLHNWLGQWQFES